MKHVFAFLLLIFMPTVVLADDACINPQDFSWDKRCYVTRGEKMDFPYNRIVRINDNATGTIIGPNTILTCRSCVNPEVYSRGKIDVEFYTSDGNVHYGTVTMMPSEFGAESEWAIIDTKEDIFDGPFLNVADNPNALNKMGIGFSSLKILSDEELIIVKSEYDKIIRKHKGKTVTPERIQKIISELDERLKKHKCKSSTDKSCVNCNNGHLCIFDDFDNMKKQYDCEISGGQPGYLYSNCVAGDMGSPLVDVNNGNLLGIVFTKSMFFINVLNYTLATKPSFYYENVKKYLERQQKKLLQNKDK